MTTSLDYSSVRVRLPDNFLPELVAELRERFPKIQILRAAVDHVTVSCDRVSDLVSEVYDWTLENLTLR